MFSSKSEREYSTAAAPAQIKRPARPPSAASIIGADLIVNGMLTSTGEIQLDGQVNGNVRSSILVVSEGSFIHGDIVAENVTVRGRVQGNIRACNVLLASTCHVEGIVLRQTLAVETGAYFEGSCRHSENPLATHVAIPVPPKVASSVTVVTPRSKDAEQAAVAPA